MGRMPSASPSLVLVLGSVTPPGRLHRAVTTAAARARERDARLQTTIFDLAGLGIAFADGRPPSRGWMS
jgi:hypothetical protein